MDDKMAQLLARDLGAEPEQWWWLSFADGGLPAGSQFLGVAIVRGHGIGWAASRAHMLGINPGGAVQGLPVPEDFKFDEAKWCNRLLTRADCEAFDREH